MKKNGKYGLALLLLLVAILMFSCGKNNKKELEEAVRTEGSEEVLGEEKIDKLMEDFKSLTKKKDLALEDLIEFIDGDIELVGKTNGDIFVYGLEERLESELDTSLDRLRKLDSKAELVKLMGQEEFLADSRLAEIKNPELKAEVEALDAQKYKILRQGDQLDLAVDYDKFLKYENFISDTAAGYFNIRGELISKPSLVGGDFNIEFKEMNKRILKYEDYIVHNKDSERLEDVILIYRESLVNYFKGTEANPVLEEGRVNDKILAGYKDLASNKEGITPRVAREYVAVLRAHRQIAREDLEVKILSLVNEALSSLEDKIE